MNELIIVELICVFFLGLYVLKPLFNGLNRLTGLVYLVPVALGILICSMAVYEFRPEMLPLVAFALVLTISAFTQRRHTIRMPVIILLFLISTALVFYFKPSKTITRSNVSTALLEGTELKFRLYQAHDPNTPLLILFPGSLNSVDALAAQAQKRGFAVFSCTVSAKKSIGTIFRRVYATLWGHRSYKANNSGRLVEEEWRDYISKALLYLKDKALLDDTFFIAGYGTAGSAAISLFGEPAAKEQYPELKGIIAIESHLWSSYQTEERALYTTAFDTGLIQVGWYSIVNRFIKLLPPKLVLAPINPSETPVLFLTAGKIRVNSRPYQALIEYARSASSPIVAVPGAGILDYSDYPARYPIISALFFGGFKTLWKRDDFVIGTVTLIANFASQWTQAGSFKQTKHSDKIYFTVN